MKPNVDLLGDPTRRCMLAMLALEGTWMHYRLAPLPKWGRTLLDALVGGGAPPETLREARRRLAAFPGRPPRAIGRVA